MEEIEPYMKNLKYEFDHWDDAIHGYRETEWLRWNKHNSKIIDRIRTVAFPKGLPQLSLVHILDLSEKGWIKPHIDSVRFCGEIIAGLSLLTDSVMRFTLVGHEKECYEDFLLPRRSLYIISGMARYKFNHEILKQKESFYQDKPVIKTRRISVICRCEPNQDNN
ncbi:alpha-ketoglutarate-dependent dioxygenase alkB homolog 7, mitochondrial isoform X2 [Prorops nasuta]